MKMLGNDVLTQDEFDTFEKETFKPFTEQVQKGFAHLEQNYLENINVVENKFLGKNSVTQYIAVAALIISCLTAIKVFFF